MPPGAGMGAGGPRVRGDGHPLSHLALRQGLVRAWRTELAGTRFGPAQGSLAVESRRSRPRAPRTPAYAVLWPGRRPSLGAGCHPGVPCPTAKVSMGPPTRLDGLLRAIDHAFPRCPGVAAVTARRRSRVGTSGHMGPAHCSFNEGWRGVRRLLLGAPRARCGQHEPRTWHGQRLCTDACAENAIVKGAGQGPGHGPSRGCLPCQLVSR